MLTGGDGQKTYLDQKTQRQDVPGFVRGWRFRRRHFGKRLHDFVQRRKRICARGELRDGDITSQHRGDDF
jgi:hypothetical protein|tara:strand:- start:132 stop:341 length:210 start_codon:yes stop_codon:yes gene_type:complete